MSRTIIDTKEAPRALGPYSQGVAAGGFVFVSGQLGLDPATGALAGGGAAGEAERALRNMAAVLEAAGARMDQVVRVTLYLADLADFPAVNGVFERFFPKDPPARATVRAAGLPKGARIEVEAQAWKG